MSSRDGSKAEKERQKQLQDKCQEVLTQLLRDDDNKYCVDCDAKGPRWASWNIGVFLCIRCAGIHRNLGVHISKVKSVNLDSWTPEQVVSLQQMGNSRARAVYEATLPDTWRRPQTDSSLETFIRAKYQHKRYIAKEWVPPPQPKVDWEKELDEEAEKQKKKKKEKQQQISSVLPPIKKADVRVPALPKPSSSPKSSRAAVVSAPSEDSTKTSSAVDLLGLSTSATTAPSNGNSEDMFSSFLSAPAAPAPPAAPVTKLEEAKGRSAEEDSFFNQPTIPAAVNDPKKPLSKDSIMALYSSQSAPPPQPTTMFHAPGMYPANQNMGFPVAQTGGYPVAGAGGFLPPAQGFPQPFLNGMPAGGPNPFFGMSTGAPPQAFPLQHGSQNKPSVDLLADITGNAPAMSGLPQQMAGLNLGSVMPGAPTGGFAAPQFPPMMNQPPAMGQTFTTHLWQ